MEGLIKYIIKGLTGSEGITLETKEDGGIFNFEIKVPSDYMGLVIGKEGKTIKAIRALVKVRAALENKKVYVNVSPVE